MDNHPDLSLFDECDNIIYNFDTGDVDLLLKLKILDTSHNSQNDNDKDIENFHNPTVSGVLDDITHNLYSNTHHSPEDLVLPSNIIKISNNSKAHNNNYSEVKENFPPEVIEGQYLRNQLHEEYSTNYNVKFIYKNKKHVKIWECEFCKKLFAYKHIFMRHLPTHTFERKFKCLTCSKSNLKAHIYTHSKELQYLCDICGKGFRQMSNLMRHKFKVHKISQKAKLTCRGCGECFPKKHFLRQHQQNCVKLITSSLFHSADEQLIDKTNSTNAIIIEPIETEAMRCAIESNQTPYALLRPAEGVPVLVRILPAGDKQMLVPVLVDNLKKHSNISVISKVSENGKLVGKIVKMQIPIVAVIKQQICPAGQMELSVISTEPDGELTDRSKATNLESNFADESNQEVPITTKDFSTRTIENIIIQYLDEYGRTIGDKDCNIEIHTSNMNDVSHQDQDLGEFLLI